MAYRPVKGMTEERRHRSAKALRLRRDGRGYSQIGEELSISTTTAWEDVQLALKEIIREPAEELLTLELERLDDDYARLTDALDIIEKAAGVEMVDIDKWTAEVARLISQRLAVSDRRSKLLGMDKIKPDTGDSEASKEFTELLSTLRSRYPKGE